MKSKDKRKRIYVFDIDETLLCAKLTDKYLDDWCQMNHGRYYKTKDELVKMRSVEGRLHLNFLIQMAVLIMNSYQFQSTTCMSLSTRAIQYPSLIGVTRCTARE